MDIIGGGVKSTSKLPEHASVLVNHRIAVEESVESTRQKDSEPNFELAKESDLGSSWTVKKSRKRQRMASYTTNEPLEPAPVTPINDARCGRRLAVP